VELLAILSSVLAVVALAVSLRVQFYAARSLPQRQVQLVDDCVAEVTRQAAALAAVETKVAGWRVEIENLLTQVDDSLELTERKRRSTAASAAKLARAAEQQPGNGQSLLTERQQVEARARQQGLL